MIAAHGSENTTVAIGRRRLKLTNLDKVLYPATSFTKAQVIDYYARVSPVILPYLRNRPLTLKRYPDGVNAPYFYEKMCPSHRPPWVSTIHISSDHEKRDIDYCLVNDPATLIWVANLASIELHTLLATTRDMDRPTFVVFDHDPGDGASFRDCIRVALQLRHMLDEVKLEAFAKTSGGKGLHVYLPLNGTATFDQAKTFAKAVAETLAQSDPKRIAANMRKDLRQGRVLIDWSQNVSHKTTVTAYSLRAMEYPAVSAPMAWDELEAAAKLSGKTTRTRFDSDEVLSRIDKFGDPFAPVLKLKQRLPTL